MDTWAIKRGKITKLEEEEDTETRLQDSIQHLPSGEWASVFAVQVKPALLQCTELLRRHLLILRPRKDNLDEEEIAPQSPVRKGKVVGFGAFDDLMRTFAKQVSAPKREKGSEYERFSRRYRFRDADGKKISGSVVLNGFLMTEFSLRVDELTTKKALDLSVETKGPLVQVQTCLRHAEEASKAMKKIISLAKDTVVEPSVILMHLRRVILSVEHSRCALFNHPHVFDKKPHQLPHFNPRLPSNMCVDFHIDESLKMVLSILSLEEFGDRAQAQQHVFTSGKSLKGHVLLWHGEPSRVTDHISITIDIPFLPFVSAIIEKERALLDLISRTCSSASKCFGSQPDH